ncbi:hypothetical protein [Mesorhizobium sp. B2-6-5]|uniref:hypothetical protein n=1 Tax=Mesorhizobium sp. B2-6-5 TaxID=2589912 RepID=UPI00112AD6B8|nr:hypothetical protein [Mesorhizobium sp. B2-6-5]TPJ41395.1 hypothetical protein FJ432_12580 [Mesorhizobium sp. B2-6-5]
MPIKINLALPVYGAAYKACSFAASSRTLPARAVQSEIEHTDIPFSRNYLLTKSLLQEAGLQSHSGDRQRHGPFRLIPPPQCWR